MGGGWPLVLSWEGVPHPQARPKVTRRGRRTVTYKPDQEHQDALREIIRAQAGEALSGSLVVACAFYLPDRRTRDIDNLMKHVLDSANGVLFADDRQVTALAGFEELDREKPRTIVMVGADEVSTLRR